MLLPDVTEWSADKVEAILTDVSLWEKPVRAIAEQEGIHIENIVPGYPASSAAFILNRKHVVKIFTPSFHRKREVETEVLKSLASIYAVPSSRIWSEGVLLDRIEWPYLILEYLPGIALRELLPNMGTEVLADVAVQLGTVKFTLHEYGKSRLNSLDELQETLWPSALWT